MAIDDPHTWAQGAAALKTAFDTFKSAVGLVKEIRQIAGGTPQQSKAVDEALEHAEQSAAIAEAEVAKALGYELCKCQFPPTIMLTVGRKLERAGAGTGPVYECPKCGYNTAGMFAYDRLAPTRQTPPGGI
jgi:hypothetical protein